jgi:hypothetical protein
MELQDMKKKYELSAEFDNNSALQSVNQALAKKEAQIAMLQNSLKAANAAIQAANSERVKTIDAHQSRIKHLQEKYLNDLQKESIELIDQTEQRLVHDRENELEELKQKYEQRMQDLVNTFEREFQNAEKRSKNQLENLKLDLEDHWKQKIDVLESNHNNLKVSIIFMNVL